MKLVDSGCSFFLDPFSAVHFVPRKRFRRYKTKYFARKWWGIQPLIKISSPEMSPFAEDFVITDIYICSLKQQYREICVKMQQYLCELHLCMDG